jgi:YegS/Rv2252/BmrU family lipid kinase
MKRTEGWAFIVNPIAGNGFGATCVETVKQMMKRHGAEGEIVLTEAKGHATALAASFADRGFRNIVGVGGDGTLSEMAQPLVGRRGVTFGAVAAGTGNDFIHILGFPDRFTDSDWAALFEESTVAMDAGRCNGKYFINGMGLGFDAQVAYANYHMENGGGVRKGSKSKYMWQIVKTILQYHEKDMLLTIDGRTEQRKCFLNTIANGRRLAGGLFLTPRAVADDGLLDICITEPLSIPQRFKELVSVMKQTHLQDSVVHYHQSASIVAEFTEEVPAHLDGELIFGRRFQIDAVPGALRAIYNPKADHYFRR